MCHGSPHLPVSIPDVKFVIIRNGLLLRSDEAYLPAMCGRCVLWGRDVSARIEKLETGAKPQEKCFNNTKSKSLLKPRQYLNV